MSRAPRHQDLLRGLDPLLHVDVLPLVTVLQKPDPIYLDPVMGSDSMSRTSILNLNVKIVIPVPIEAK